MVAIGGLPEFFIVKHKEEAKQPIEQKHITDIQFREFIIPYR